MERIAHPLQHFIVELKPAEKLSEFRLQHLLPHIVATASSRIPLTFVDVPGAMIVDISLLLDLADHRAAAPPASDQAGKGEVISSALGFLGEAAIKYALDALPQVGRN